MKNLCFVIFLIFLVVFAQFPTSTAVQNNDLFHSMGIEETEDFIQYSTYIGGLGGENINDACVDDEGCIYITGWTKSDFTKCIPGIGKCPGFDQCLDGDSDAFVLKLSPDGTKVMFITYIGGDKQEVGFDVEVNDKKEVFVTGWTQSSEEDGFPIGDSIPGFDTTHNHFLDTFVIKLSPDGSDILFSTYIGGYFRDVAFAMDLDLDNNVIIAGWTESCVDDGFPIGNSIPGFDTTFNGQRDSFLVKLSSDGTTVLYSTYFGGSMDEAIEDVTVDTQNSVYITGWTTSSTTNHFPIESSTPGIHASYHKGTDAFVGKLDLTANQLVYASYIGGDGNDTATCIAVDTKGCAYIVGKTESSPEMHFPVKTNCNGFDKQFKGENDGFVIKLSPNGEAILYSSFIGGSYFTDVAYSIAISKNNTAYITGWTNSSEEQQFPIKEIDGVLVPGFDTTHNGHFDVYLIELSQDGNTILYSTFLGGSGPDFCNKVLFDKNSNIYVVGSTSSKNTDGFPIGDSIPGLQKEFQGVQDGFVIKLKPIVHKPIEVKIILHVDSKSVSVQHSNVLKPTYKSVDCPPFKEEEIIYIPLRFIMEELHSPVQWDAKEGKITLEHSFNAFYLWPNRDKNVPYNVEVLSLLDSIQKPVKHYKENMMIVNGRTVLHLESFYRLFEMETVYHSNTDTIVIKGFLPTTNIH